MTRTPNLIPLNDSLSAIDENNQLISLDSYSTNWEIDNATFSLGFDQQKNITNYAMSILPVNTNEVTLYLRDIEIVDIFNEHTIQFHALVKSESRRLLVQSSIFRAGDASEDTYQGAQISTALGSYGVTKSDNFISPETVGRTSDSVSVKITIAGHNGERFYMTYPTLINIYGWSANNFVQNARTQYLPHFYWDIDQQQDPEYPFYKLLDVLTHAADEALVKYAAMFPYSLAELPVSADGLETWANSNLVSPLHVAPEYLEWLGQFSGAKIQKTLTAENIDIDLFKRWQITSRRHGTTSGGTDSLIEAASLGLRGKALSVDASIGGRIVVSQVPVRTGISSSATSRQVWQFSYDGSYDHEFDDNLGTGFNGDVNVVRAQSDGKILCGGSFTTINGTGRKRIARLNIDGTLDTTFVPGNTFDDNAVSDIAILSSGDIIVSGSFTTGDGDYLRRINSSGSPVAAFNSNVAAQINGQVNGIATMTVSNTERIVTVGQFTTPASYISRFYSNGSADGSFNSNVTSIFNGNIHDVAIRSDNSIVVVGEFTKPTRYVAVINEDGTENTAFTAQIGKTVLPVKLATTTGISDLASFSSTIDGVALSDGDRVLIKDQELTATITAVTPSSPISGEATYTANNTFNANDRVYISGVTPASYTGYYTIVSANATAFVVSQPFTASVISGSGLATGRREQNGVYTYVASTTSFTRTTDFNTQAEIDELPFIAVTHGTANAGTMWKLRPNTSPTVLNTTFLDAETSTYDIVAPSGTVPVSSVAVNSDDKIVIGGTFTSPSNRVARILEDGRLDTRFNNNIYNSEFSTESGTSVSEVLVDSNNDIFVAGEFYPEIKKLNSDGTENMPTTTQILRTITDSRSVAILPYYEDDPWKIHVLTLARETADTTAAVYIQSVEPLTPNASSTTYTTTTNHSLAVGDTVTIRRVFPISLSGTHVVTSATNTSFTVNNTAVGPLIAKSISQISGNGSHVVYTTTTAHGLSVGDEVGIAGSSTAGYNGVFTLTNTTSTTFTANNTTSTSITFPTTNNISPSTPSTGKVTYTTAANHGLSLGDRVTIVNAAPSGYNGDFTVTAVSSNTAFVVNSTVTATVTDHVANVYPVHALKIEATASHSSDIITELLEYVRPMGYVLSHSSENLFEFTLDNVGLGKLSKSALG